MITSRTLYNITIASCICCGFTSFLSCERTHNSAYNIRTYSRADVLRSGADLVVLTDAASKEKSFFIAKGGSTEREIHTSSDLLDYVLPITSEQHAITYINFLRSYVCARDVVAGEELLISDVSTSSLGVISKIDADKWGIKRESTKTDNGYTIVRPMFITDKDGPRVSLVSEFVGLDGAYSGKETRVLLSGEPSTQFAPYK